MDKNKTPGWEEIIERLAQKLASNINQVEMLDILAALRGGSTTNTRRDKNGKE